MTRTPPLCQNFTDTRPCRYPLIFAEAVRLTGNRPANILSYGCSLGDEVVALRNVFPPGSTVTGYDKNHAVIIDARKKDPEGIYTSELPMTKFDVVFCMSVLCIHPLNSERKSLNLEYYELNIVALSDLLNTNGLLVLFNSQFPLMDTEVGKQKFLPAAGSRAGEQAFVRLIDPVDGSILRKSSKDDNSAPFQNFPDFALDCPVFYRRLKRRRI